MERHNKLGFKKPDDYFENLESQILDKLNEKETKVISLPLKKLLYGAIAVAASFLLVFTFYNKTNSPANYLSTEVVEVDYLFEAPQTNSNDTELLDFYISNKYSESLTYESLIEDFYLDN